MDITFTSKGNAFYTKLMGKNITCSLKEFKVIDFSNMTKEINVSMCKNSFQ